ncbi:uncharacterized protein BT62DRAFT_993219 [Guyanagaster necrorhizus]|uniref:Uncharacterized protein n=1 Tax=Guyanagaster necrorhizus TaxID=856835 RepID=A0A9P8AV36_9AGAR|nr:uncharacterized protein BT62DRAFT_993219 [Guyanagaster necrorhizus MCA 3950]KAG7447532.1 hypothetical protein BT62DRAFT_993219 [Guyanagaster necrorhizus MCA 3950]
MAAETSRKKKSRFACKCLNVQIKASKPVGPVPAELATEPGFAQVYVKHDGISAAHPQLTLRIRSRGTPIEGSSRFAQFMSLGCLVCRTLVYRAFTSAPLLMNSYANLATREGPVIPKSGWVEDDVLRTPSGWIEVFEGALTEADISLQEESPQYSPLFSLVLPPIVAPSFPKSPTLSPPPTGLHYLKDLEPMYSSNPATSDPVFLRLSNIAATQSEQLRLKAEQDVNEIVNVKIAQLLQAEDELKAQVQVLVDTYREGLRVAEEEGNPKSPTLRSWKEASSGDSNGATVSVRDFVPVEVPATSTSRSPPAPRVSTLSASLATSSFHHPRAIKDQAPHDGLPSSIGSSITLTSEKSHLHNEEGVTVLQFRRNLDDGLNTAASYRYFVNLEEEMARHRKETGKQPQSTSDSAQVAPGDPEASRSTPSSKGKERESPGGGERPPSLKPKRRVTFDVQSEERSSATGDAPQSHANTDMVFDLEEEEGGERPVEVRPVLPLIEQTAPARPNRPRSHRQQPEIASSLSSFRPLSLLSSSHRGSPNGLSSSPLASSSTSRVERPSPLRTAMSLPDEDPSVARESASSPRRSALSSRKVSEIREVPHDNAIDIIRHTTIEGSLQEQMDGHQQRHDEEIMRLLAAGTPSHRAAWSNGGKAWGQFLHRGRERMFDSDALAEDDYEVDKRREHINDHYEEVLDATRNGVPGSLPVRIKPLVKPREVLSLASYKPQMIGARE